MQVGDAKTVTIVGSRGKRSDTTPVAEERGTNGLDSASRGSIYSRFNLDEKPRVSRGYQLVILPRKYD
jgi:hypothetical protein